jgi:hypothetical protein
MLFQGKLIFEKYQKAKIMTLSNGFLIFGVLNSTLKLELIKTSNG